MILDEMRPYYTNLYDSTPNMQVILLLHLTDIRLKQFQENFDFRASASVIY